MAIKPGWIQTYSGKIFYPADPDPKLIDICDIAAGLAKCCRWAGQCKGFYSVAQHSVYASHLSTPMNALWLLMHDSAEAYLRDLPGPVKIGLTDYQRLENKLLKAISIKFELPWPMPDEVHEVDQLLLATESYYLMKQTPEMKEEFPRVLNGFEIIPSCWERAEANFLMRATKLFTQREIRK